MFALILSKKTTTKTEFKVDSPSKHEKKKLLKSMCDKNVGKA
jgi:hypothetical protein